ncbi:MAG: DNA primase [Gammaproteobacteria bacterium]|nr:DNA primase [Gammaproteobacteria bacterium]
MAGQIPKHFIDDLLNRIDIVDVIGQRIKLKKSGSNYSACCPFHSEKTPSFTVSQTKQFYHCFGCSVHGNAIGFLMEYDGMHFVDAVETLADSAGVEVPRESRDNSAQREQSRNLYELMGLCSEHFNRQLKNHETAIEYLKQRGLSGETAKNFGLGYAPPGWNNLTDAIPGRDADLLTTGMLTKNEKGNVYDRFRDRIMFPIRDRRGRVIAFGGRVLDSGEPKYLNSPETPLFHKGSELYGLFEGRKQALDAQRIIVVEGYMDVIALAEQGVGYAVATLGTATNQQHCESIFKVVPELVFCFDGDRAGRDAAWRGLQSALPCLRDGRDAFFLFLPDGEDPDSLVRKLGREGFEDVLTQKKPAIDFLFEHLAGDADLSQIGTRARLAEQAKPLLQTIPEGVYRQLATKQLENAIGLSLSDSHSAAPYPRQNRYERGGPPRRSTPVSRERTPSTMRSAIQLLLQNPALVETVDPEYYDFDPGLRGASILLKLIAICDGQPTITTGTLIEHFRDTEDWKALNKLAATPYLPDGRDIEVEAAAVEFAHCITTLNRRSQKSEADKVSPHSRVGLLAIRKDRGH